MKDAKSKESVNKSCNLVRVLKSIGFLPAAQVKFKSSAFFLSGPAGVAACSLYSEDVLNLVRLTVTVLTLP